MAAVRRRGNAGVSRRRQKGQGHQGFPAPLDSPTFPLDATPFGRASKCEGPTGVFGAPRVHPLIEAELFAAPNKRPTPSGRALLCAAVYAS